METHLMILEYSSMWKMMTVLHKTVFMWRVVTFAQTEFDCCGVICDQNQVSLTVCLPRVKQCHWVCEFELCNMWLNIPGQWRRRRRCVLVRGRVGTTTRTRQTKTQHSRVHWTQTHSEIHRSGTRWTMSEKKFVDMKSDTDKTHQETKTEFVRWTRH